MNKLYKGHYLLIGLALLVIILIITSWKGCNKADTRLKEVELLEKKNDTLKKILAAVQVASSASQKEFEDSLAIANGWLAIKDNQIQATESKLEVANGRIQKLLAGYTPVTPSDTNTTLVPNKFINDCADCFTELEGQNNLVNQYKNEIEEKDLLTDQIILKHAKREDQLELERQQAYEIAALSQKNAEEALKKFKPRRTVYLTLSAMGQKKDILSGFGAGLLYQDKHRRMFGGKAYATSNGGLYTADIAFPLSFKRK